MYLMRCALLNHVLDSTDELLRGFALRVSSDSRFDFRENTDDGVANIGSINYIISTVDDVDLIVKFTALRDYLIADANKSIFPFISSTESDWDKAQSQLNPTTVECSYPSEDFILYKAASRQPTSITITVTEPLPYDDVITVICNSGNTENTASEGDEPVYETNYSQNIQQRAAIAIPANFVGSLDITINVSGLKTKVKVFATSKFNRNFTASVANTGA